MINEVELDLGVPEKAVSLYQSDKRYVILEGGRGSAKSWSIADFLLLRGYENKERILCAREIQNSIKDSVHKLLADRITALNLDQVYRVTDKSIRCINGTEFLFKGLRHNVQDIKSTEGITKCWCEEAQSVSRSSLGVLIPTIRQEGSQIYFSYNRQSPEDPVHVDFVESGREDVTHINMNYWDNRYFPEVLRKEMEWDKKTDPDKYEHIWCGKPLAHSEAQIFYGKWRIEDFDTHEKVNFYYGADWGFAKDPSTLIRSYEHERKLYIDYEAYEIGCEITDLPKLWKQVPNSDFYTVIADNARPEHISYMNGQGFNVRKSVKGAGSIIEGIKRLRGFEEIIIHSRCTHAIDEFKTYCYKIDRLTGEIGNVPEDKNNHCFVAETPILTDKGYKNIVDIYPGDLVRTRTGFNKVIALYCNGLKGVKEFNISKYKLTGTDTHEILTPEGKVRIKDLSPSDYIYKWSYICQRIKKVKAKQLSLMGSLIEDIQNQKDVLTGITSPVQSTVLPNICIELFMKMNMEKSKKDIMSIIRTAILSIMHWTIWLVLPVFSIYRIMQQNIVKKIPIKLKEIWITLDLLQKNGIEAKKAERGIGNMRRTLLNMKKQNMNVNNVEKAILLLKRILINFALMLVNLLIAGQRVLMILLRTVSCVIKSLKSINILKQKHAQDRVQMVYDIEVEDNHEYFANDILVSNCVDALRYSTEGIAQYAIIER